MSAMKKFALALIFGSLAANAWAAPPSMKDLLPPPANPGNKLPVPPPPAQTPNRPQITVLPTGSSSGMIQVDRNGRSLTIQGDTSGSGNVTITVPTNIGAGGKKK